MKFTSAACLAPFIGIVAAILFCRVFPVKGDTEGIQTMTYAVGTLAASAGLGILLAIIALIRRESTGFAVLACALNSLVIFCWLLSLWES